MKRGRAILAALLLLLAVAVPPAQAAIPQGAITWTVDHQNATITISVKLEIYPSCSDDVGTCQVDPIMVDIIRNQILRMWNRGAHFRCYELIFDVDITLGTDRFHVDDDRVGVRIDQSPVPIRSWVASAGSLSAGWDSDDPADKVVPENSAVLPTSWAFPPSSPGLYAHEFGHVIGLHDTYRDPWFGGPSEPIEGAPRDLMNAGGSTKIAQETIDRLVKRSGVIDLETLRCEWQMDAGGTLHRTFTASGLTFTQDLTVNAPNIPLLREGRRITGSGPATVNVTFTAVAGKERCTATFSRTERLEVEGTSDGAELGLRLAVLESTEPYTVTCPKVTLPTQGLTSAAIWPEVLGEIRLPADGGRRSATKSRTLGPLKDTSTGEFLLVAIPAP